MGQIGDNRNTAGHLLALLTMIVWGTTFISTKILLRDFQPVEILFSRFIIGFTALIFMYPHRLKGLGTKQEITFAGAGLCGICMYFLMENIALTYTMASNVAVILSAAPFATAIASHIFMRGEEKFGVNFFIGFAAAMAGIFLISFNGVKLELNPLGDILALLAAVVWAVYSVLIKKIGGYGYNTIAVTRRVFFYGLLFMIPALFIFDFEPGLQRFAEPVNIFNIVFLGLGASAICFATWNYAVKILGVIKSSVYIYLNPVVAVIASALILHERITGLALIGTVLTLAGLFISEGRLSEKKKDKDERNREYEDF